MRSTTPLPAPFVTRLKIVIAAALALVAANPAIAQTAAGLSTLPTVDRDRSDRITPALPHRPQSPPILPHPVARISDVTVATLAQIRFEGATLPRATLEAAVAPFVGRPLTAETLQAIATAVGASYAKSDIAYYGVVIPPQVPTGGLLTLRITEGRVTRYTLNGVTDAKATARIAAQIRRILHDAPLRKSTLDRALSLMRDLPGQTIEAQIRQLDATGALAIDLKAHRKFMNVALILNNDGIANVTSAFQAQVALTFNNVLRDGDRTQISSYLPIHPDRYQYYSASHATPIGNDGLSLAINGAYLRTRSQDSLIIGTAKLAGVTLSYPIRRSATTNLSASLSLDGIDSSNYFLDTRFGDYRSRAVRAGLSWSRTDDKSGYAFSAVLSRGIDGLGARAFTGFSVNDFTKINLQGVVARTLSKTIVVRLTTRGQYSADQLPVTERAAIGGPGAGRAFQAGAITGEKAATGQLEIDWTPAIKVRPLSGSALFAFVDGGVAGAVARPLYGLPAATYSLASAGGGVRIAVGPKWRATLELAVPIKRPTAYDTRKPKLFFGIGRSF